MRRSLTALILLLAFFSACGSSELSSGEYDPTSGLEAALPPTTFPTTTTTAPPPTTTTIAHKQAPKPSRHQQSPRPVLAPEAAPEPVSGSCGGDLPPCWVMRKESGGDPRIWNGRCYAPVGWKGISPCGTSSASGIFQITRGTWAGFGGYLNAADAPLSVQLDKARALWAGGKGCSHWSAC